MNDIDAEHKRQRTLTTHERAKRDLYALFTQAKTSAWYEGMIELEKDLEMAYSRLLTYINSQQETYTHDRKNRLRKIDRDKDRL